MSMQADWTELMTAMTASIAVRQLADRSVAVDLQNPMWEHDYVTVLVQETPGGWRLSDAGVTALELDSLGQLCEHSACAGLDMDLDEDELVTHVSADSESSDALLASTVVRFAAQLASVPTMARLLDCATSTKSTSTPRIDQMAREARNHLWNAVPALKKNRSVRLGPKLERGPIHVKPRLVVYRGRAATLQSPAVACEFIDLEQNERSRDYAYQSAAGVFQALRGIDRRFLIANGPTSEIEQVASLFDKQEVVTLRADELDPLVETVRELEGTAA